MKGGYGRRDNGVPGFGRVAEDGSVETRPLAVFCSGLLGPETGGRLAYGFVVASCFEPPNRSLKSIGVRPSARGGGGLCGLTEGLGGQIVHSHATLLLGDGPDGKLLRGLDEEITLVALAYRAALAALGWLAARGRFRERIVLLTGPGPLSKREEEPFGLWRATRRRTGGGRAVEGDPGLRFRASGTSQ